MSVTIAELAVSVTQDPFHSKKDSREKGLFENAMRETCSKQDFSGQKEKSVSQKNKQIEIELIESDVSVAPSDQNTDNLEIVEFFPTIEHQNTQLQENANNLVMVNQPVFMKRDELTGFNEDANFNIVRFLYNDSFGYNEGNKFADNQEHVDLDVGLDLSGMQMSETQTLEEQILKTRLLETQTLKMQAFGVPVSESQALKEQIVKEQIPKMQMFEMLPKTSKNVYQDKSTQDNVLSVNVENQVSETQEGKHQGESLKLANQQNLNSLPTSKESVAKSDAQPVFSNLTSSHNVKEFTVANSSNLFIQTNEQNQASIGLKIGNITHQEGVQTLKISILPQELGTIKLDLKTNVETKLTEAHFTFSHQDGFDLFQGNRQDLLALLGKSGLDIQPDKVSFDLSSFADSSSQFTQEHHQNMQDLNQKIHFFRGLNNEPVHEEIKHEYNNIANTSLLNVIA